MPSGPSFGDGASVVSNLIPPPASPKGPSTASTQPPCSSPASGLRSLAPSCALGLPTGHSPLSAGNTGPCEVTVVSGLGIH